MKTRSADVVEHQRIGGGDTRFTLRVLLVAAVVLLGGARLWLEFNDLHLGERLSEALRLITN